MLKWFYAPLFLLLMVFQQARVKVGSCLSFNIILIYNDQCDIMLSCCFILFHHYAVLNISKMIYYFMLYKESLMQPPGMPLKLQPLRNVDECQRDQFYHSHRLSSFWELICLFHFYTVPGQRLILCIMYFCNLLLTTRNDVTL